MAAEVVWSWHIFIDVVGFTNNRSAEAQTEIISRLNRIVKESVEKFKFETEDLIFIPTGDGLCISILNQTKIYPYDADLRLAIKIVEGVENGNLTIVEESRRYKVRVGLYRNHDNKVKDINEKLNIAGMGISLASRIMSFADGSQILVGEPVYDVLKYREEYMDCFVSYSGSIKHGTNIKVHQFVDTRYQINIDAPTKFKTFERVKSTAKISNLVAYYICFSHIYNDYLRKIFPDKSYELACVIGIYVMARNANAEYYAEQNSSPINYISVELSAFPIDEMVNWIIKNIPRGIIKDYAEKIVDTHLEGYSEYFMGDVSNPLFDEYERFRFITDLALPALREGHSYLLAKYDISLS